MKDLLSAFLAFVAIVSGVLLMVLILILSVVIEVGVPLLIIWAILHYLCHLV